MKEFDFTEVRTALIKDAPVELLDAVQYSNFPCQVETDETKIYDISIFLEEVKDCIGRYYIVDLQRQGYKQIEVYKDFKNYKL